MTNLGLTPRCPDNLALLSLCHTTPRWLGGLEKEPRRHSFIQIHKLKCPRKARKMQECAARGEIIWALSPEVCPAVPRPSWWKGSCVARHTVNPAARPLSRSRAPRPFSPVSAAAGAESPRPGRSQATVGGQRRAVSPPPARPQGRGRCQGDGT